MLACDVKILLVKYCDPPQGHVLVVSQAEYTFEGYASKEGHNDPYVGVSQLVQAKGRYVSEAGERFAIPIILFWNSTKEL